MQSLSVSLILLVVLSAVPSRAEDTTIDPSKKFSDAEKWIYGILTGIGLGLVGFFAAALVVYLKKYTKIHFDGFLKFLVAFAAGALLGDAVIHLIPEAFSTEEEGGDEGAAVEAAEQVVSQRLLSFFVCLGIFIFTILERVFLMMGVGHSHSHGDSNCHVHQKHDNKQPQCGSDKEVEIPDIEELGVQKSSEEHNQNGNMPIKTTSAIENNNDKNKSDSNEVQNKKNHQYFAANIQITENVNNKGSNEEINIDNKNKVENSDKTQASSKTESSIDLTSGWKNKKPEGFLNQLGDFLHNIMDGLALGVAFSSSDKSTVSTTIIAIFAHEIPQEMGNASILLSANFSGAQAMFCNGMVNFSCIIGIIIGIAVASLNEKSEKLMNCFIAGNFLYIGAAEMLPKLTEEKSHRAAVLQILALALGFGVMFLILLAE